MEYSMPKQLCNTECKQALRTVARLPHPAHNITQHDSSRTAQECMLTDAGKQQATIVG
jgi:hypothetical protein